MLSARGIEVRLGDVDVLAGVDLDAGPGHVVGLIGPNGSGKTTLLRTLYRSLAPRAGLIRMDGEPIAGMSPGRLARRLAVVAQEPPAEVPMRVLDLVLLGRSPHRAGMSRFTADDENLAATALARVGLDHLITRDVTELSGGERQRALIARALTQDTDYLLLDEPTNHLDPRHQHEILGLVRGAARAVVVVLHDVNLAARYCDRLVLLEAGRVARAGDPREVCRPDVLAAVYGLPARVVHDAGQLLVVFDPTG